MTVMGLILSLGWRECLRHDMFVVSVSNYPVMRFVKE